jgi:hypothetical protein
MPIMPEYTNKATDKYCNFCADENGVLKSREIIQQAFAQWLESFTPQKENIDFMKRADYYLKAMPVWTKD